MAAGSPGRRGDMRTSKSAPDDALHGVDHLQHREALRVAAVEHFGIAAVAQVAQRRHVGAHEVGDVDVVADAGAVRRWIVGAEHLHVRPLAERRLAGDLDEVRRMRRRLAGAALRVGARDVEIAQRHVAEIVRPRGVGAA